jgi:hypothetical protein
MTLRYTNKPFGGHGPQQPEDWRSRFPSHARPIDSAPMSSRPVRLFEPDGKSRWGIHHMGCWREVEAIRDTYGNTRVACNGNLISNPIMWASS